MSSRVDMMMSNRRKGGAASRALDLALVRLLAVAGSSAVAVGFLAVQNRLFAVVAAGLATAAGVFAIYPAYVAVIAVPGIWLTSRTPGGFVSVTDVLVTIAAVAALAAGASHFLASNARRVLGCFAFFAATFAITLTYNPSLRSDLELLHRIALVPGSILVGAWLVRTGLHHRALQILLCITMFISADAVLKTISSGLAPAYPFGIQKNFVGSVTATLLLVILAAGDELRLPRVWLRLGLVIITAGLLASQSRGGMLGVGLGVLILLVRSSPQIQGRRMLATLLAVALVATASVSVHRELSSSSTHSSITQRLEGDRATKRLWLAHPFTGVGLRFFKTPTYAQYQPPNNDLNEALAEGGVPALIGLLVFIWGSMTGLARGRGPLATAALCVVAARFAHGLVDIYWVGGTTTLVWLIAGMGLATSASLRPATSHSTARG